VFDAITEISVVGKESGHCFFFELSQEPGNVACLSKHLLQGTRRTTSAVISTLYLFPPVPLHGQRGFQRWLQAISLLLQLLIAQTFPSLSGLPLPASSILRDVSSVLDIRAVTFRRILCAVVIPLRVGLNRKVVSSFFAHFVCIRSPPSRQAVAQGRR